MVSQDRWIDEWDIEAGPDEGDPATMLADARLGERVRTDATEADAEPSRT